VSDRIHTAYINNINMLIKAGCSELGAKMAADMLLDKEVIVKENEQLKKENAELHQMVFTLSKSESKLEAELRHTRTIVNDIVDLAKDEGILSSETIEDIILDAGEAE